MASDHNDALIQAKIAECSVPTRLGVKTSLESITALLDRLGHPERNFPTVHVGGTSGKGSTTTYIANSLTQSGYKVGIFTKPHLVTVRERFVIDGKMIPQEEMLALLEKTSRHIIEKPTWFELMTAMAFQYFSDQQVDVGVVEVGLGGTLDATNVLLPVLSVLTNVGLDHTDILGNTIDKIAIDKAGIIKDSTPLVTGVTQPSVIKIVERQCSHVRAELYRLGRDFTISNLRTRLSGSTFDFLMSGKTWPDIEISMLGEHQVMNASLALASVLCSPKRGFMVTERAIREAFRETCLSGRMEVIGSGPIVLIDGAHSPPKMSALANGIKSLFGDRRRIIGVIAFSLGHDASDSLAFLAPLLHTVVTTEFSAYTDYGNKRAQSAADIAKALLSLRPGLLVSVEPDPYRAVRRALELTDHENLVCVTGSIFLVGQVRGYILGLMGQEERKVL